MRVSERFMCVRRVKMINRQPHQVHRKNPHHCHHCEICVIHLSEARANRHRWAWQITTVSQMIQQRNQVSYSNLIYSIRANLDSGFVRWQFTGYHQAIVTSANWKLLLNKFVVGNEKCFEIGSAQIIHSYADDCLFL